jgi:hypothetical protein
MRRIAGLGGGGGRCSELAGLSVVKRRGGGDERLRVGGCYE